MVATYLTPGVYVEELPGGARAVEGVATSVTLFLGYTLRGPTGADRAVRISSWSEYERRFGGVVGGVSRGINDLRAAHDHDPLVPKVDLMGHAVFAYFQNGGAVAYVGRMATAGGAPATGTTPAISNPLSIAGSVIPSPANDHVKLTFSATDAGTWANDLVIDLDVDTRHAGHYVATVGRLSPKGALVAAETYDNVAFDNTKPDTFLPTALVRNDSMVRLEVAAPGAAAVSPDVSPSVQHGFHRSADVAAVSLGGAGKGQFDLSSASADDRTVKVQLTTSNTLTDGVVPAADYPTLEALAAAMQAELRRAGGTKQTDLTVSVVREGAKRLVEVVSGDGGAESTCVVADSAASGLGKNLKFGSSEATKAVGKDLVRNHRAVLFDGSDGAPDRAAGYTTLLEELQLNNDINVVVTPNAAWDDAGRAIVGAAVSHCDTMRNRVVIIDPPLDVQLDDPTKIDALQLPTGSTYTQVYYPWVRVANPVYHPTLAPGADLTVLVPPSGFAAGMWGRIDSRRGVWKAPAGVETGLLGVDGFRWQVGDPQQQVLNPAGVNALRAKPGYGNVIWGARTLCTSSNPEWRYIPVRRTAIMIEESLRRGIQWAVFEPNDDRLWSSLRLAADGFMGGLFRSGAFQGTSATEAYQVECGLGSTMDQGEIDRGYVILRVRFRPLKPAEFVVIQIQQLAGQA